MGVHGQKPRAELGQNAHAGAVGHDVRPVVEIVLQSESVSQFMGGDPGDRNRVGVLPQHRPATGSCILLSQRHVGPVNVLVSAEDDEVDVCVEIEFFLDLCKGSPMVVVVSGTDSDVNHGFILGIPLIAEGPFSESVPPDLVGERALHLPDRRLHPGHDVLPEDLRTGREVDHPHGARLSRIQEGGLSRGAWQMPLEHLPTDGGRRGRWLAQARQQDG